MSPETRSWQLFGQKCPRQEVVFLAQTGMIYIVILASIVNLSLGIGESNLWVALLSSCLGYLLPNPTLKQDESILRDPTEQ
jgi:hypothetical protein